MLEGALKADMNNPDLLGAMNLMRELHNHPRLVLDEKLKDMIINAHFAEEEMEEEEGDIGKDGLVWKLG